MKSYHLAAANMSNILQVGQKFEDIYEIMAILGTGGFGTVYKARQLNFGRVVALKILHAEYARDNETVSRFLREAQALNDLSLPNIVRIYGMGVAVTGQPYLVMELIEGKSVRQLLREHY